MAKIAEMFPGKFLKGDDITGTPTVKIASIAKEIVGQDNTEKHVVFFEGMQKGLVLNRTNADAIGALYGDETDDWVGEEVTLFSMPVSYQGKTTNAVRVRMPKRLAKKATEKALDDEIPF